MAVKSKVFIDIITQITGIQNVKAADSAFDHLKGTLGKLGLGLGIEELVRKSVEAFKQESAAVAQLDNSLRNLGTSYSQFQPIYEKQLKTFNAIGFNDTETLTAISKLTVALGNPAKALDTLGITADLARTKQMSLSETAALVSKAIAGNSRAFADLGLKIDKTLTPANAFDKLLSQAKQKVGGAAKAYAGTLGGALDVASAKAEHAKAKLGEALAPTIIKLADSATKYLIPVLDVISKNVTPLLAIASALGAVALGLKLVGGAAAVSAGELALNPLFTAGALATSGVFAAKGLWSWLKNIPKSLLNFGGGSNPFGVSPDLGTSNVKKQTTAEENLAKLEKEWAAASKKYAADQAKADAASIAAKKQQLALQKAQQVLAKSAIAVDANAANIVAALAKTTDPQTAEILKLQLALINQDADAAGKLAQNILATQEAALQAQALDPFNKWAVSAQAALDQIRAMQKELTNLGVPVGMPSVAASTALTLAQDAQAAAADAASSVQDQYDQLSKDVADFIAGGSSAGSSSSNSSLSNVYNPMNGNPYVVVNVQGNVWSYNDLAATIQNTIQNNTANGSPVTLNRSNYLFGNQ